MHQFFNAQPSLWSSSHIHTWLLRKTIALTSWTFVSKVMSLLFNTLYRFVSLSSKEQVSFNFMAAVIICSDFGAPKNKVYCCLVARSCLILCDPMDCSTPGFPVLHYLPEFAQSIGASASASVLPMNIQDLFPLGLTGLISKGLSRVSSNTTVQKRQFFGTQLSL